MSVPKYDELFSPTLEILHRLKGTANIDEIESEIIGLLNLSDIDVNTIHRGNVTKLRYNLAWARNYLKRYGLLENPIRRIWNLSDDGWKTKTVNKEKVKSEVRADKQEIEEEILDDTQKDIIESDEDTKNEDLYKGDSLYPYKVKDGIDIVSEDPHSVFELLRKLDQKKLIIDPDFQRKLVWTIEQKSKFIESILLRIPLPPMYVNQDKIGQYIIIDGLQRTTTLHSFVNNNFKLSFLKALPYLNDHKFEDLDVKSQTMIEDKKLLLYVIKPTVPINMVYDIFNRINTGGTPLTRQEIRNCIFIGRSTKLVKELSEQIYFKDAIGYGISPKRMKDREAVLRYISFRKFSYKTYKNDMDEFLGNSMKSINAMNDNEVFEIRKDFERVMEKTFILFGEKNFRLPTAYSIGRVNIAILESISNFFSNTTDEYLNIYQTKILENYDKLLKDPVYIDAVRFSTGDKKRVFNRFEIVDKYLGSI